MEKSLLRKKINYTVTCVAAFAQHYKMNQQEAFRYLYDFKAISFLKENYDIEHTLSLDDAVQDMIIICRNNGGSL